MTDAMPVAAALGIDPVELISLVRRMADRDETVATAESLTAGLLTAVLTEVPGSSSVVRGGLVVYATTLKHELADVPDDLLGRVGPVHPEVADALARGARLRCGATWGVGLTGVAGPAEQDGHPVGTVHLAVASADRTLRATLSPTPTGVGDRASVRSSAVVSAIRLLHRAVGGA